jgi:uncharacterized protein
MQIVLILIALFVLGLFAYSWYELSSKLRLHINLRNSKVFNKLKLIKKNLTTSDGVRIASWYLPVKNSKAVVIVVDGYKETHEERVRMFEFTEYLNNAGYSTLLIDLRSIGESEGNKISFGVNEWKDVEVAFDYIKSLPGNRNKKIGFLGISMGASTSIIANGITGKGDFIIAATPYSSFKNLFDFRLRKKGLPSFPFLSIIRLIAFFELGFNYEYYTVINLIDKIKVPIFILSAKYDKIVNSNDAKDIYQKANKPKEYWQANTTHRIFIDKPEEFKKKTLSFLSKYA